jgi:hypothetical protein
MKVKCLNNFIYRGITIGKTYNVISIYDECYLIRDDDGYDYTYPKSWFKSLLECRIEKINKLLRE